MAKAAPRSNTLTSGLNTANNIYGQAANTLGQGYNIAQQGPEEYMFEQPRTRSIWIVPRTLKFGITGQF